MAMQLSQQICNLTCIIAAVCPCSVRILDCLHRTVSNIHLCVIL